MKDNVGMYPRFANPDRTYVLAVMLAAGPIAWSLALISKFALASNACQNPSAADRWFFQPWLFIVIDVLAITITLAAGWVAYQSWNATAPGQAKHFHAVTEVGENRQHFLALWGMLIGAMFLGAIVFGLVADITVLPCIS